MATSVRFLLDNLPRTPVARLGALNVALGILDMLARDIEPTVIAQNNYRAIRRDVEHERQKLLDAGDPR